MVVILLYSYMIYHKW